MAEKKTPAPRFYDPFAAFRSEMDRVFGDFFGERGGAGWPRRLTAGVPSGEDGAFMVPSVDVKENDKSITVTAELPGLNEDDIDLSIRDGVLTLKGEKKYEREDEKDEVHVMERRYGSFARQFRIPETVEENKVDAKFDKGVLTIKMPKTAKAAPKEKRISIKS